MNVTFATLPLLLCSWSYSAAQVERTGIQLSDANTEGGVNSDSITIKPEAIPKSGSVTAECVVTLPDSSTGRAIIEVGV